jgi:hypothetical protein
VLNICRGPGDGYLVETTLGVELAEGGDDERLGRPLRLHVGPVRRHRFRVRQRANLNNNKKLNKSTLKAFTKTVFRIRIYFIRVRIQHFRLNTDPDPGF